MAVPQLKEQSFPAFAVIFEMTKLLSLVGGRKPSPVPATKQKDVIVLDDEDDEDEITQVYTLVLLEWVKPKYVRFCIHLKVSSCLKTSQKSARKSHFVSSCVHQF